MCLSSCQVPKKLHKASLVKFCFAFHPECNPKETSVRHFSRVINSATAGYTRMYQECAKVLRLHITCLHICLMKRTLIGSVVMSHGKSESPLQFYIGL